jgi:hypothetical protein
MLGKTVTLRSVQLLLVQPNVTVNGLDTVRLTALTPSNGRQARGHRTTLPDRFRCRWPVKHIVYSQIPPPVRLRPVYTYRLRTLTKLAHSGRQA